MPEGQVKKRRIPKGRHRSVMKRERQGLCRRLRNTSVKSALHTFIGQVRSAVAAKDKKQAVERLREVMSRIEKARVHGILHRKTASRKIARLSRLVYAIS